MDGLKCPSIFLYNMFTKSGNTMVTKWSNLDIKEKLAIITAIMAFLLGWGLSIAGFIIPPVGDVADSVLWILGQALIYAASVFGVTSYFTAESVKLRRDIDRHVRILTKQTEQDEQ